jgi:WD40 repeat protein
MNTLQSPPDGKTLASGGGWQGRAAEVKLWDTATGTERVALADQRGVVYSLAFAPDGQNLAAAGLGPRVRFWDAATGTEQAAVRASLEGTATVRLAFSPDGRQVASGSYDTTVRLWQLAAVR